MNRINELSVAYVSSLFIFWLMKNKGMLKMEV